MNAWKRWVQAPQTLLLRRALFQVHLWLGLGFGIYVLAIALSGSALLLKSPFYTWFEPKTVAEPAPDAVPLTGDALMARMAEVYEGYALGFNMPSEDRVKATYIVLNRNGEYFPHYFDQFTGQDLGVANPWPIKTVELVGDLHDDLLLGREGRRYNGYGALGFVVMSVTGLVLWWQGRARWHEGLLIRRGTSRRLLWQLHSVVGFWGLVLMLAWGVSGVQLGLPREFAAFMSWFGVEPTSFRSQGGVLGFFRSVHFARYGDGAAWARWAWIVVSFVPTVLLISGLWLWCRRKLGRKTPAL